MDFATDTEHAITVLAQIAAIWEERLASDWTPPSESPFPWAQVRLSLAALLPGMRDARGWVEKVTLQNAPTPSSSPAPQERGVEAPDASHNSSPLSPLTQDSPLLRSGGGAGGDLFVTLILAGNTPLLSWSPLCAALLAGATRIRIKMSRDETVWTPLFVESLRKADAELAARIELYEFPGEDERTYALLQDPDAVIAYGSDNAIAALQKRTPPSIPFFGYGHAVSIALALSPSRFPVILDGLCRDILIYDQQGCLSPHIIYCTPQMRVNAAGLGGWLLPENLPGVVRQLQIPSVKDNQVAMEIREARDMALFSGAKVKGDDTLRWTTITTPKGIPYPPPVGHGVVYVSPVEDAQQLAQLLAPVKGFLSCAGVAGELTLEWETALKEAGVSRICAPGEMQTPPLDWPNGNRDLLAELLKIRHGK